jgi:hypothetical protein
MLKIPKTLPVRTRVPLAGWAVAGFVTLFALASSLLHAVAPGDHAMARAEQGEPNARSHQANLSHAILDRAEDHRVTVR